MSINEIAKLANVSKSTVSRVINNTGYVSKETREKVLKIIEATNYVPNRLARNLSFGNSKTVAVMCPYPGYENLIRGVYSSAFKEGHAILFFETQLNEEKERNILSLLEQRYFDSLIIFRCSLPYSEVEKYQQSNHNIVSCQQNNSEIISTISIDFITLKRQIINYVNLQKGSLGLVFSRSKIMSDEIEKAMIDTYSAINPDASYTYQAAPTFSGGAALAESIITQYKVHELPDFIWFDEVNCAAGFKHKFESISLATPQIIILGVSGLAQYANFIMLDCSGFTFGENIFNLLNKPFHKDVISSRLVFPKNNF